MDDTAELLLCIPAAVAIALIVRGLWRWAMRSVDQVLRP